MDELEILYDALEVLRRQRDMALEEAAKHCARSNVLKTYDEDVSLLVALWREAMVTRLKEVHPAK